LAKGEIFTSPDEALASFVFECPACGIDHALAIRDDSGQRPSWQWNGSMDSPTFQPSLLVKWQRTGKEQTVCHSYITDGKIQFLSDCTHAMAGQTVELANVEEENK
jgi:hypothetical protein